MTKNNSNLTLYSMQQKGKIFHHTHISIVETLGKYSFKTVGQHIVQIFTQKRKEILYHTEKD